MIASSFTKNAGSEGIFPCHSKTGSGRPGASVRGGFAAYHPPIEGGGFGPAGKKAMGGLAGNPPGHNGIGPPALIAERVRSPALPSAGLAPAAADADGVPCSSI